MKILLAHTFYLTGSPSGEDVVYRTERQLLEQSGHQVVAFERSNDSIDASFSGKIRTAVGAVWSREIQRDLKRVIERERPDVAHFHNTFPLISPSAYAACRELGVPVVQTLHNYRLICPGALLLRDGKPCETCIDSSLLPSIRHACYRSSKSATAAVVAMLELNRARGTYRNDVDRYIALTDFARERFVRGGLPADRIVVRPNCLVNPPSIGTGSGNYALYVGRLSEEKGVRTLLKAWREVRELPLKILGDGVLRSELEAYAREHALDVEFLGFRSRNEVSRRMQDATLLVIPSECYEGFPITALEAFATGTPIVASAIGALDSIVTAESGGKFTSADAASLARAVRELANDPQRLRAARTFNRTLFVEKYSPEQALKSLLEIYAGTAERKSRNRSPTRSVRNAVS